MPRNPNSTRPPRPIKVTAANTAAKKRHVIDLIAEGRSYTDACRVAEVSDRTFVNWKQRDEKFAVEVMRADVAAKDGLVDRVFRSLDDPKVPEHEKSLRLFFLIKQKDPSYRDNHKIEHVVSGGLAGALRQLAKMGRE